MDCKLCGTKYDLTQPFTSDIEEEGDNVEIYFRCLDCEQIC